jgi:predicted 3-demethylubiquinone-9 3-methyltransferase (glyoxalase superfamily)
MQKIVPCFWFDSNCEEAMNYYVDTFNANPNKTVDSKITNIKRYEQGMEAPGTEQMIGKVITGIFELNGHQFMGLDGGPLFNFTEAVSFQIECEDQAEVDHFWSKLSAVPESEQCGWCKDKYGMSWQIVPKQLGEMLDNPDKEKSLRALNAMLKMHKLDIAELERAFNGE